MAKLTYINEREQILEFGDSAPFLIIKIEGLGSPKNELYRQKSPYQDGTTITHATLDERELVLEGVILYKDRLERQRYRNRLIKVFNPKLKGELIFERDGIKRKINCMVEQAPYFPSNMQETYQMFSLIFICPNPFWLDEFIESEEMADWVGGLRFPLQLPMMFAGRSTRQSTIIRNNGDVETPIVFEFLGPATNPKITNDSTGEYIQINREIAADEKLIITTEFGNKKVILRNTLTGEQMNAFGWIDLGSTFFQLDVGENLMSYNADSGQETARVWIKWRNRYLGV